MLRVILTAIAGSALLLTGALFLFQRKLIYFPKRYEPSYRVGLPKAMRELEYRTAAGRQVAFYLPPKDAPQAPPPRLWVVFSGNASVALDWLDFVESAKDAGTAFLLIDYPGYGLCEGKPSRQAIAESSDAALAALAADLKCLPAELDKHLRVLGFSIGGAAGMEFAVRHPPQRVVLVSPFTTLMDMARLAVGRVLSNVAVDRFDNRARLDELAALPQPPKVVILHGTADDIVPFKMGQELAARQPKITEFHAVEGADHNSMMLVAEDRILRDVDGK